MTQKYELLVNKQVESSDYFRVIGDFDFFLVLEVTGSIGTNLSSLEIKCFDSPHKSKRVAANYSFFKLKPETQSKEKKFLNLSDKIVMSYSDIGKFI